MASSNLQIDNGVVKDDLNCVKCKSMPKDACLVPCGCRLCRVCINDLMASGVEFCPGPSEECRGSPLSQSVTDYRANMNILKFPIKCPNNGCVHACPLANMAEHSRVCPRKSVKCPFCKLGGTQDKMAAEEMSGHLQRKSLFHRDLLIGMINNVNNEMKGTKRDIEMMKTLDENHMRQMGKLNKADEIQMKNIESLKSMCVCHKNKIDVLENTNGSNRREIEILKKTVEHNKTEINMLKEKEESNKKEIEGLNEINIFNMKKIDMLEKTDESTKKEIELLTGYMRLKDRQIKLIMDEIKSMKGENKECTNRMATLLAGTKREIDQSRDSSNTKVIEYVDKGLAAIKKDIQSINQGTQSIKTDIDSLKSQVPTDDSLAEKVLNVLFYAHEKRKGQRSTSRRGGRNVRRINDNSGVTLRGRVSNEPRSRRNSSVFSYDSPDEQHRDVTNNGIHPTDWTSLRYPRTRGRPTQRRNYRRRGSRFGMEAVSPYVSGDEDHHVQRLGPDTHHGKSVYQVPGPSIQSPSTIFPLRRASLKLLSSTNSVNKSMERL